MMDGMTPGTRLAALRRAVRARLLASHALIVAPIALAIVFAALRAAGPVVALGMLLAAGLLFAATMRHVLRHIDLYWVARRLDAAEPALEDSTGLLLQGDGLRPLQAMQRARIAARLASVSLPELRPAWPMRRIAVAAVGALVITAATLAWQAPVPTRDLAGPGGSAISGVPAGETRISSITLEIAPPAYTGLAARSEPRLEAQAPAGAALAWRLRFEPRPGAAELVLHDGRRIALRHDASSGDWHATHVLESSLLYRVVVTDAPPVDGRLHRLDAITDQPPQVRVVEPEQNVVYAAPGQTAWSLVFEAADDYGLGDAALLLTVAQGSGELVDFTRLRRTIEGAGDNRRRRYTPVLDLEALGLGPGDDLVVQLEVADNRAPDPHLSRSPNVVLRWPPPAMGDVAGFDGLMHRDLPAYFRSQRQIIIDTEALVAAQDDLPRREFLARAGAIGADQQQLRLRYGQFMGEEAEGDESSHDGHQHDHGAPAPAPARRPPAANPLFADDHVRDHDHDHEHEHEQQEPPAAVFGDAGDVLERWGHVHDIPEAATLFDPRTREILRGALRAMWEAEGLLGIGEPAAALPHEYRALELVKEAQRANRIYLARVGLELPPIDESRRLGGDIDGVTDRADPLRPAATGAGPLPALWAALRDWRGGLESPPDFEAAQRWIVAHPDTLDDPLGLVAAIDEVQRDPGCADCLARLRAALWPALPVPAAGVLPRAPVDETGTRFLDALARETRP